MATEQFPSYLDGSTILYGIAGDPISQTISPQSITALFAAARSNAVLVPLHILNGRFVETMRGLMAVKNFKGSMITYPFKVEALGIVDRLGSNADRVGAINAMRREADGSWTGEMFDGKGLLAGLDSEGIRVQGLKVLLLGAGGAGSAIAFALAEAGIASLAIVDLDEARASKLSSAVKKHFPHVPIHIGLRRIAGHDLLINATTAGMQPHDDLPIAQEHLQSHLIVMDIVPKADVPLLRLARQKGCRTIDYNVMAKGQMATIAKFFMEHQIE